MPAAASWTSLALAFGLSLGAHAQTFNWPNGPNPASSGWPFGPPHRHVTLVGVLARADFETLCIELPDQRVIRFQVDEKTQYKPNGIPAKLTTFRVSDVVSVDSEVDGKGYLLARSVRFVRRASPDEQAEILHSPELMQKWSENLLALDAGNRSGDDRRLNIVAKPKAIIDRQEGAPNLERAEYGPGSQIDALRGDPGENDLIPLVRRRINDAFDNLPSLRAREVTSLFHSTSKPVKWIPDTVVSAEIGYEEERESYSDIQIDGKRPAGAPTTGSSDYMRSLDKAWSTGDFETLSHCIFSELEDSDFHRVRTERGAEGDVSVYEFTGGRNSACLGVKFKSQIAYPGYKGLMKVRPKTREVVHVELEAIDIPAAFPLDRAERSVDFGMVRIGENQYLLPTTGYWFGCFRNSYSCFLNRIDFRDYRRFEADSTVKFSN
jgi:hypothetical protein